MIAIFGTILLTMLGIGPIGTNGRATTSVIAGHELNMVVAARSELEIHSQCNWLDRPRVIVDLGLASERMPRGRWTQDHAVIRFGPVAFNGMSFVNFSDHAARVQADIFDGCTYPVGS